MKRYIEVKKRRYYATKIKKRLLFKRQLKDIYELFMDKVGERKFMEDASYIVLKMVICLRSELNKIYGRCTIQERNQMRIQKAIVYMGTQSIDVLEERAK